MGLRILPVGPLPSALGIASLLGLAGLTGLAACRHVAAGQAGAAPAAAGGPAAAVPQTPGAGGGGALAVRRGELRRRLLLTGELKAARAEVLTTPVSPLFQIQITWLAEDGAPVAAGQPVVQFDNSSFVAQIEEKRAGAAAAAAELARLEAETRGKLAERAFTVEQKRRDLAKARTAAAVPAELLSAHDFQDLQLKLQSAESELAKAEEDRATERSTGAADVAVQRVALAKAQRELAAAEAAIRDLTVRAPRAGTVLVADHPWEGRKLQVGDNLWPGTSLVSLPELSSIRVEAALSDVDDRRVAPGMEATCVVDAFPETAYRGRVTEVAPVARESGRSALLRYFPVIVELAPLSPAQLARLRPGMSVRVEIAGPPLANVLLVPRAALDLAAAPARALLAGGGAAAIALGPCDAFWCVAAGGIGDGQALRLRTAGSGG